jgi:hypothetical protein
MPFFKALGVIRKKERPEKRSAFLKTWYQKLKENNLR